MDLGAWHVAAACLALAVGAALLVRPKGGRWHVLPGRAYLGVMVAVNAPALLLYDATGRPGPFHALAVVSLVTTALGWLSLRGLRRPLGVRAHASFMTWSWIGVATAGLAQLANRAWPEQSPWPVVIVVGAATAIGLVTVPRFVGAELRRRGRSGAAK